MRARLAEESHDDAMAGLATGLLAEAFPGGSGEENDPSMSASWTRCEQLLPHAMALFEHIPGKWRTFGAKFSAAKSWNGRARSGHLAQSGRTFP